MLSSNSAGSLTLALLPTIVCKWTIIQPAQLAAVILWNLVSIGDGDDSQILASLRRRPVRETGGQLLTPAEQRRISPTGTQPDAMVPVGGAPVSPADPAGPGLLEASTTNSTSTSLPPIVIESDAGGISGWILHNNGSLVRAMWVLLGLTLIILLYFGVRYVCMRKKRNPIRKYDILSNERLSQLVVESDSDEEDVYDTSQLVKTAERSQEG